ncbi:MAG: lipoprotein [Rhodocyclaceae bacterium]|nr:lipoprotein [Rhodocyclaceae bacterium]
MHFLRHGLTLLASSLVLAACGNKGQLTLPPAPLPPTKPTITPQAVSPDHSSAVRPAATASER